MCAWAAAPLLLLLMVPMATSVPLVIAVPLDQHTRYRASRALTALLLGQLTALSAPKGPCVPPLLLNSLLPAQLVRTVTTNYSPQCQ